ncbi:MAG: glutathione S-transferase family protein [Gammaproteobacteria bacterium]
MLLYSSKTGNSPRKVRIFLAEKGIQDIELKNLDLMQMEHKTPEYRAKVPNAKVPALELEDGTIISESTAICRYLEALYPDPNLFGESPMEIAAIEMWQSRIVFELMLPLAMGFRHTHPAMAAMENQNESYGIAQREVGIKSTTYFDKVLSDSEFIAGDRFTFADIQMISTTEFFLRLNKIDLNDFKNLVRYTKLISSRPSYSA